jgi:hypothetical protein
VGAPAGAAPTRRQGIQHTRLTTASNRMRLLELEDEDDLPRSAEGCSAAARTRSHSTQTDILHHCRGTQHHQQSLQELRSEGTPRASSRPCPPSNLKRRVPPVIG